jgi:hypothetical protein
MTGTQNGRIDGRVALCNIDHLIPFTTHNEVTEFTNQQQYVHAKYNCFQNFKNTYTVSPNTYHLGLHAIYMENFFSWQKLLA